MIDLTNLRDDFPILSREVNGHPLVYLDSAATTQKPVQVLDAVDHYYRTMNANVHRGAHALSVEATDAYEGARARVASFINAGSPNEVVFTRGTTSALNTIAYGYGLNVLKPGDKVLLTIMEHHSNIVPWQMACARSGATLKVAPVDDRGVLDLEATERLISERTKIVAMVHVSNTLGTVNPVARVVERAHRQGAKVLVDGAQALAHIPVDVTALGCDFYAFSGHKLFGPTGIGCLYGKATLLEAMAPWQGGGEMILSVSFEKTVFKEIPHKFEAGTPPIVEAIGLGAALNYMMQVGRENIAQHEAELRTYAHARLAELPWLQLYGNAPGKGAIVSFTMDGLHPHDISTIIDRSGVAVRAGHHCAQPLMERPGVTAVCRASFGMYNTMQEVDALVDALKRAHELFA